MQLSAEGEKLQDLRQLCTDIFFPLTLTIECPALTCIPYENGLLGVRVMGISKSGNGKVWKCDLSGFSFLEA